MGYRNDQFFNLPTGTGTGDEPGSWGRVDGGWGFMPSVPDNPSFPYPARYVHTYDRSGNRQTTALQRGYIRSLVSSINGVAYPPRKCGFQFNPSTLSQTVEQPTSYLNFLQQDAGQYVQPIPGNVNFGFDLMFDRSMEMNNSSSDVLPAAALANPWELGDPGEVGVLRDLAVLYAVIGQGLSEAQHDYVLQTLSDTIHREATSPNASEADKSRESTAIAALNGPTGFLELNLGNSAFLMPMPVRAVFSSLYIVEGLVQRSAVTFTKFNTKMVPMQCSVSLMLEAKYVGFAKKQTFLSVALDQARQEAVDQAHAEQAVVSSVFSALQYAGQSVEVSLAQKVTPRWTGLYMAGGKFSDFNAAPPALSDPYAQVSVYARLSNSVPVLGGPLFDTVKKMFDDGDPSLTISDTASVEIWGPVFGMDGPPPAPADRLKSGYQAVLKQAATLQESTRLITATLPALGVSTGDDWTKLAKGSQSQAGIAGRLAAVISDDKFYIFRYHGSVTVTVSSDNVFSYVGEGEVWELVGPTTTKPSQYSINQKVSMKWPGISIPEDALGSVSNVPSATPPGSTSKVGSNGR